jgi:hypothetical protein
VPVDLDRDVSERRRRLRSQLPAGPDVTGHHHQVGLRRPLEALQIVLQGHRAAPPHVLGVGLEPPVPVPTVRDVP